MPNFLILLLSSCFIWIAGISASVVCFLNASPTIGWAIAGGLLVLLAAWFAVFIREVNNAVELADHFGTETTAESFVVIEGNFSQQPFSNFGQVAPWDAELPAFRRVSRRIRGRKRSRQATTRKPTASR